MKKHLMTLAVLFGLATMVCVTTSCGDDEPEALVFRNGITVDLAALYNEFGIASNMTTGLNRSAVSIIDSVLVYDQTGNLVVEFGSESKTLQYVNYDTKDLKDGTYHIIVWQTAAFKTKEKDTTYWHVYDKEQLRTVKITTKNGNLGAAYALGYAYATVTITDGEVKVILTPKSMGSVIGLHIDNFTSAFAEQNDCDQVRLYCNAGQLCNGLYLDPRRSDRWISESNQCIGSIFVSDSDENKTIAFFTLTNGNNLTFNLYTYDSTTKTKGVVLATKENVKITTGDNNLFYFDMSRLGSQEPFYGTREEYSAWKKANP